MRGRPVKLVEPEVLARTDEAARSREEEYERLQSVTAQMGTMQAQVEALPLDDAQASRLALGRRARASDDMKAQAQLAGKDARALTASLLQSLTLGARSFGALVREWGQSGVRALRKKSNG